MGPQSDKRAAILDSALTVFAQNGFHASPISAIANHAGAGVGSIYRYFKDKDELIRVIFEEIDVKITKAVTTDNHPELPIKERLILSIVNITRYFIANSTEYKFIEQYYNSPYGKSKKREELLADAESSDRGDHFIMILKAGKEQKQIKDMSLCLFYALALGPIIFLLREYNSGFVDLNDAIIQQVAESAWEAIKI